MKLRYFVIDDQGQLSRVRRARVEALWRGRLGAEAFGCTATNELRLVSVLCDNNLLPKKIFLLRLPLTDGFFTRESYLTLRVFSMPDCVTPREVIQYHTEGWPRNFFLQLAVVLDVPRNHLEIPVGIGGPLLMAAALRVTPRQAIRYLR